MKHDLEANKSNAEAFYRTAYQGDQDKAVRDYVGADYKQHNPLVADGKAGFIDYFNSMNRDYPHKNIAFVRAIAQDDLVALHTLQTWPGNEQFVTMDFFRFDDQGKIVEHWDAIQTVPEVSKNGNTMY